MNRSYMMIESITPELEGHKRTGKLMKILRYDGGIRLVDPHRVYSIEFPANVSVVADEQMLEECINQ